MACGHGTIPFKAIASTAAVMQKASKTCPYAILFSAHIGTPPVKDATWVSRNCLSIVPMLQQLKIADTCPIRMKVHMREQLPYCISQKLI
jgi:hypothetical protein